MIQNIPCRSLPMPYYVGQPPTPSYPYETMPFTIKNEGTGTANISYSSLPNVTVYASKDGGKSWSNAQNSQNLRLAPNETLALSSAATSFKGAKISFSNYTTGSKLHLYGNIASLLNFSDTIPSCCFTDFLKSQSLIYSVDNLVLGGQNVGLHAYRTMFEGCSYISGGALVIPSLNPSYASFAAIFYNCNSMKKGPIILYNGNVGNLGQGSWSGPNSTTTTMNSFFELFSYCNSLTSVEVKFTDWGNGANNWMASMTKNSGVIFIKPPSLPKIYGTSQIPFNNWIVLNRDENNVLWETDSSGNSTTKYTGEDPYSDYYGT